MQQCSHYHFKVVTVLCLVVCVCVCVCVKIWHHSPLWFVMILLSAVLFSRTGVAVHGGIVALRTSCEDRRPDCPGACSLMPTAFSCFFLVCFTLGVFLVFTISMISMLSQMHSFTASMMNAKWQIRNGHVTYNGYLQGSPEAVHGLAGN